MTHGYDTAQMVDVDTINNLNLNAEKLENFDQCQWYLQFVFVPLMMFSNNLS